LNIPAQRVRTLFIVEKFVVNTTSSIHRLLCIIIMTSQLSPCSIINAIITPYLLPLILQLRYLSLLYFSFISFFPRLICLFICILLIAIIEIWLSSTCACVWLCVMIGMFSRARRSNFNVVLVLSMSNLRPRHHISILYFISLSLFTENLTYLVPSYRTT